MGWPASSTEWRPLDFARPLPGTTDITALLMPGPRPHASEEEVRDTPGRPEPPSPEVPAPWYEKYAYWRPRGPEDVYEIERTDEPALWESHVDDEKY